MSRPHLHLIRTHANLSAETLLRIDAIVGDRGRSQFIRDAVARKLEDLAPLSKGCPYFEVAGGEHRLTPSGTAAVLAVIRSRRMNLDEAVVAFGFYGRPVDFLHALLGQRALPNAALNVILFDWLPRK